MKKYYLLLIAIFYLGVGRSSAQEKILLSFDTANGGYPRGSLVISGSKLFGMTWKGGAKQNGVVFTIDTNGSNYKDLLDFNNTNGASPYGNLVILGTRLYGVTPYGGKYGSGVIFSIDTNGSGYKDLYDFITPTAYYPEGSLIYNGHMFYGMTEAGGLKGHGTIFSIDTNGAGFNDIHDFNDTNGGSPTSNNLILFGNRLYGMTTWEGAGGDGCIFSLDTNGNRYKDIFDFNSINGGMPWGSLIISGSKLYGMSYLGGTYSEGLVFSIDTDGSAYNDIYNFSKGAPYGDLTLSGGVLFGMAEFGGSSSAIGNVFSLDTDGNNYKDMLDFKANNGAYPYGNLTLYGKTLYGMTLEGGTKDAGIVFKIDTDAIQGINELTPTNGAIKVFPNPSNGIFQLQIKSYELGIKSTVNVYNALGQKVLEQTLRQTQGDNKIDLCSQPAGIYFYRVIAENSDLVGSGKLIIEN